MKCADGISSSKECHFSSWSVIEIEIPLSSFLHVFVPSNHLHDFGSVLISGQVALLGYLDSYLLSDEFCSPGQECSFGLGSGEEQSAMRLVRNHVESEAACRNHHENVVYLVFMHFTGLGHETVSFW